MKKILILLLLVLIFTAVTANADFLQDQKKYSRVSDAIKEKGETVKNKLKEKEIEVDDVNIIIVAYKAEDKLEIYSRAKNDSEYKFLIEYDICKKSGELGPKRKQGDYQVPEGFYYIEHFNPSSQFHLSLKINYPNQSDRKKGTAGKLGGDIFIHGACCTIGCIPMTDEKIKEIYLYAVYAKNNGQEKVPVYIFPFKMTDENFKKYKETYKTNSELISFWANLKTGYDRFIKDKKELKFTVDNKGDYIFPEPEQQIED